MLRKSFFLSAGMFLLAGVSAAALSTGAWESSFSDVFNALTGQGDVLLERVIRQIRLPRLLLGIFSGACFAVSGAILQSVMHNPLVSPGIIGISAGGGLAGVVFLLVFPDWILFQVPAAFLGSFGTAMLVFLLAWKKGSSPIRLVLAGVAVSAMLGAFSSMLLYLYAHKAGMVMEYSLGSLSSKGWDDLNSVWLYMTIGLLAAFLTAGKLDVLALGDDTAFSLGLDAERTRFFFIVLAALLAAGAVSAAGLLGFVGLIAPHIVRLLIGSGNRWLLPGSAVAGAVLVCGCDTLGKCLISPAELPAGMITSFFGPLFFLWLLRKVDAHA